MNVRTGPNTKAAHRRVVGALLGRKRKPRRLCPVCVTFDLKMTLQTMGLWHAQREGPDNTGRAVLAL